MPTRRDAVACVFPPSGPGLAVSDYSAVRRNDPEPVCVITPCHTTGWPLINIEDCRLGRVQPSDNGGETVEAKGRAAQWLRVMVDSLRPKERVP